MSKYSGMSVENSIAAYQQDSGDEQKAQAECEQYAAEITERNIVELETNGKAIMADGVARDLTEIIDIVEPEFFACAMIDLPAYFDNKELFIFNMIKAAIKKSEPWIYQHNYKHLVKS